MEILTRILVREVLVDIKILLLALVFSGISYAEYGGISYAEYGDDYYLDKIIIGGFDVNIRRNNAQYDDKLNIDKYYHKLPSNYQLKLLRW